MFLFRSLLLLVMTNKAVVAHKQSTGHNIVTVHPRTRAIIKKLRAHVSSGLSLMYMTTRRVQEYSAAVSKTGR
jgi:hypothetical protein